MSLESPLFAISSVVGNASAKRSSPGPAPVAPAKLNSASASVGALPGSLNSSSSDISRPIFEDVIGECGRSCPGKYGSLSVTDFSSPGKYGSIVPATAAGV